MSTQEIVSIYKRLQIQREQSAKKVQELMNQTMEGSLTKVFKKYYELLQNPKISVAVIDEAKRDMTKTLDVILMDSDHDVIMALTNNLLTQQYKAKVMK